MLDAASGAGWDAAFSYTICAGTLVFPDFLQPEIQGRTVLGYTMPCGRAAANL